MGEIYKLSSIIGLFSLAGISASAIANDAVSHDGSVNQSLTVDDYFMLDRVRELSLSPDGEMIAYVVERQSLEENRKLREVHVAHVEASIEMHPPSEIQDGRSFTWIPRRNELAFLAEVDGTTQIFSFDPRSGVVRQRTEARDSVARFRFAPNGESIAYTTRQSSEETPTTYQRFQTGEEGILINPDYLSLYDFVNPNQPNPVVPPAGDLWLRVSMDDDAYRIDIPGTAREFHWSSGSDFLSITYVADEMAVFAPFVRTSVGVYRIRDQRFQILGEAYRPSDAHRGRSFSGGEWFSGQNRLVLRRSIVSDLWVSPQFPSWAVVELPSTGPVNETEQVWREIGVYDSADHSSFFPINEGYFYTNQIIGGVRRLERVSISGHREPINLCPNLTGSYSLFDFSMDFETAVFVNESLTQPPEIHIWNQGPDCRQLTNLNGEIADNALPIAREMIWDSRDGTSVHGWLLEPTSSTGNDGPWPLITFVHGGPSRPMVDEFAGYFPIWPFPFESYASHGMAVFIPNYRGTHSYGRAFASPEANDGEPIDDIVSGIEYLIELGIADPERLAISGHSHGAWLAPLVMTRANRFRAASFAEGVADMSMIYQLMPGVINHNVHDVNHGGSVYDLPDRYIELSADMHLRDVETAILIEAGSQSLAIAATSLAKAARHFGMPNEYIIYPRTSHNISMPRLQRESAERNLDWFRFWLMGEEDSDNAKTERYMRWRSMREY